MMIKTILNRATTAVLCLMPTLYASDNLSIELPDSNHNPVSQYASTSTPSDQVATNAFDGLSDELKLHICQQVCVNDIARLGQTDKDWYRIAHDKEIAWAFTAHKLNQYIDSPINDPSLKIVKNVIEATITSQAKFIIHNFRTYAVHAIKDNGKIITIYDLKNLGISIHEGLFVKGPSRTIYTEFSSADGNIRAGTTDRRAYITTDFQTTDILPIPANIVITIANCLSPNGCHIVGYADSLTLPSRGFYWSQGDAYITLLSNSKGPFPCDAQCIDNHANMIGGTSFSNNIVGAEATIWLSGKYHFIINELLVLSPYILPANAKCSDVRKISPNGQALCGILSSTDKLYDNKYWSWVFPAFDNLSSEQITDGLIPI